MSEKYKVIAKITEDKFVKYHTTNLLSFVNFLDAQFPTWRWLNVYNKEKVQIANYTKFNRPKSPTV